MTQFQCPSCGQSFSLNTYSKTVSCPCCGGKNCFITADDGNQEINYNAQQNYQYGFQQGYQQGYSQNIGAFEPGPSGKQRGLAALFAILLGTLGIHYFYLGKTTAGIIFLLITCCSCGVLTSVASFIQGIIMLTMTQEKFEEKYIYSNETLPLF